MAQWLKQSTTINIKLGQFVDKADGVTPETALTLTVKVSKNGGALAARNSATAIAHDADGYYTVELNTTDTGTLGALKVTATDSANTLGVWQDFMIVTANIWDTMFGASILTVNTTQAAGTAWGSGAITAASIAADAITAAKIADGAIDAATFAAGAINAAAIAADAITDAKVASDVTIASVTGAVGSVTGNVGGSVASVTTVSAGAITAASLAADTITAAKVAADVTTEIQAGLATAANLATVAGYLDTEIASILAVTNALPNAGALTTIQADLDDIQARLPAALVSGRIDASVGAMAANTMTAAAAAADLTTELQAGLATAASLTTVAGYIDTEVAAIKAVTDALPNAGALTTIQADLDDIQARIPAALVGGRIDASVGAMAANVLTATAINADAITAAKVAADVTTELQAGLATAANLATLAGYVDTEVAAIKAVTDALPNAGALTTIQADLDDIQTRLPAALIGGKIDASVGALATGAITAASIAADAFTAAKFAADVTTELQAGLATAASLTTVAGYIDTEVAAIKAVTDALPNAGALTSLATAANLATVAGYIDTEVAAIKAVTDALPNAGALTTIQSDLDNIQTRIPAALVSGRIDASIGAMAADTLTASALATDAVTEINNGMATQGDLTTLTGYLDSQITVVADILTVDTYPELPALPPASGSTLIEMIQFTFQWFRFAKRTSNTQLEMLMEDETTTLQTQSVSDSAGVTTVGLGS